MGKKQRSQLGKTKTRTKNAQLEREYVRFTRNLSKETL